MCDQKNVRQRTGRSKSRQARSVSLSEITSKPASKRSPNPRPAQPHTSKTPPAKNPKLLSFSGSSKGPTQPQAQCFQATSLVLKPSFTLQNPAPAPPKRGVLRSPFPLNFQAVPLDDA